MQKHVPVIAAAVLAVGGLALGQAQQQQQWQPGQQPQQQGQIGQQAPAQPGQFGQMGDQAQPAAGQMGSGAQELTRQIPSTAANVKEDATSKREVQKVIAQVTEAAVTEGRFDQIRQSLAKSDQDRLQQGGQAQRPAAGEQPGAMGQQPGAMGQQPGQQTAQGGTQDLDTAIKELRQAYKDKYNKDLKFSEEQVLPQQVTIVSGEVTNPQMLTQWPLRASSGGRAGLDMQDQQDQAQPAAGGMGQQAQSQRGGLKQGDKIAAARLPRGDRAPELTVSLVQSEGGQWALDIPDSVDSNKLRQNLSKHIRHITDNKDSLPQDADKASQHIAHHVLMALYDVDAQPAGGMGGGM